MPRAPYDDEHRILLQGLMCKSVMNYKEVMVLLKKALKLCNIEVPEKTKEVIICLFDHALFFNVFHHALLILLLLVAGPAPAEHPDNQRRAGHGGPDSQEGGG